MLPLMHLMMLIKVANRFALGSKSNRIVVGGLVRKLQAVGLDTRVSHEGTIKPADHRTLCWQTSEVIDRDSWDVGVGNSSAFFTALLLGLCRADQPGRKGETMPLKTLYDSATRIARAWIDRQRQELIPAPVPQERPEFRLAYTDAKTKKHEAPEEQLRIGLATILDNGKIQLDALNLAVAVSENKHAQQIPAEIHDELDHFGILPPAPNKPHNRIELWRGCLEVKGYVCCDPERRQVLGDLRTRLEKFRPAKTKQAIAAMIVANPGAGKSNLVKRLAEQQGMEFLPFNITTMVRREDVLSSFDQIVTTQARHADRPLLLFFDEINAQLEGQHVYEMFLAPIEDGTYVRNGFSFIIRPCVWLFAGTRTPGQTALGRRESDNSKASDFMSRMTLETIDLSQKIRANNDFINQYSQPQKSEAPSKHYQLERVYLGVSIIRALHPDLRRVRESVLRVLRELKPSIAPRRLRVFLTDQIEVNRGDGYWRSTTWIRHESEFFTAVLDYTASTDENCINIDSTDPYVYVYD